MTTRIAVNGFGRIGRIVLRQLFDTAANKDFEVVAINDLTDAKTLAHLLKYDSVHGRFSGQVNCEGNTMTVNGHNITILSEKDPSKLPWADMKIDLVLECTGAFTTKEKASVHTRNGAKKVLISAPSSDPDVTIVYGVNSECYDPKSHHIVSCASCTTNCLAPVAKVLHETFGIIRGTMTTIHSYTNDQRILDLPHKDLRRARAAAMSMIPTTTGAAKALGLVMPALKGKVDGFAMRVPTADVSVVDFVCELQKEATADELNSALKKASETSLKGILDFCTEPLVSIDFTGTRVSSTVDAGCTMVIEKKLAKVVSWYDNEAGFSARMIDLARLMMKGA